MSYTKSPATMFVFAVPGRTPNSTGMEHDVAVEAAKTCEKPLSVARRPLATLTAEPISAWYVLEVTEMLAAKTRATSDKRSFTAKIQVPPLPIIRDSRLALLKLCLYKGQTEKILRNLSNPPPKDAVTLFTIQAVDH